MTRWKRVHVQGALTACTLYTNLYSPARGIGSIVFGAWFKAFAFNKARQPNHTCAVFSMHLIRISKLRQTRSLSMLINLGDLFYPYCGKSILYKVTILRKDLTLVYTRHVQFIVKNQIEIEV